MFYWAQKYQLYYRIKRPVPGTNFINKAMNEIILFAPLIFSLGNLTWSNLISEGFSKESLVPNLISIGLSIVILLFPTNYIIEETLEITKDALVDYEESRIFMPSEYDRLNPSTFSEGFKEYKAYLTKVKQQIKESKNNEKDRILANLIKNSKRGGMFDVGVF
jgi:hypothetical protein